MKIIYLHQYFTTPSMSGGTRSYEIGRRLVAAGHSVDMITSWREGEDAGGWRQQDVEGMRVHWLPVPYSNSMRFVGRLRAFLRFAVGASRYAARMDADVIFATSTPLTIALPAVRAARKIGIPMVFEVRDLWPELPIAIGALNNPLLKLAARWLERYAYRNAARVVALSPGMADGVARGGVPRAHITVAPNSADLEAFERDADTGIQFRKDNGIPESKILVGYAGTLGRINGVDYLVRLAETLRDDERFHFLIIGDGLERPRVQALAESSGVLGDNLAMLGSVPKTAMPAVLSGVDIATSLFIPLPEMESNSANKFFDALAAGCCVAINYGGWQETLINDWHCGLRLPVDIDEAARTLQRFVEQDGALEACGENARKLASLEFSRDHIADRVREAIEDAVDATNSGV